MFYYLVKNLKNLVKKVIKKMMNQNQNEFLLYFIDFKGLNFI